MSESMVVTTYGKALFGVAEAYGKVDEILEEMIFIDHLFRQYPKYYSLLLNPGVEKSVKKLLIKEIFEGKITQVLLNFMMLLFDKRRFVSCGGITEQYQKYVSESRNLLEGMVVSAIPLEEDKVREIQETVSRLMRKEVTLHNKIDPQIIGGIKIFVEDKTIDASVQTRLKIMKDRLKAVSV